MAKSRFALRVEAVVGLPGLGESPRQFSSLRDVGKTTRQRAGFDSAVETIAWAAWREENSTTRSGEFSRKFSQPFA
jgi:hypothetical protein